MHMRQNLLALLPLWLSSSDARGLSQISEMIGAVTRTSLCRCAWYTTIPSVASLCRSFTISPSTISRADTWLEVVTRWMFSNFAFSDRGNPASIIAHASNLFHFFDLAEKKNHSIIIMVNVCVAVLTDFHWDHQSKEWLEWCKLVVHCFFPLWDGKRSACSIPIYNVVCIPYII